MKQIKQILTVTLVLVFLLTIFAGCGAGAENKPAPAATVEQSKEASKAADTSKGEDVELQFWDMVWGPKEYIETASKLVDQYNQQSNGVTVKYQSTPWNNWYQTFATAIASGSAPDISTGAGYQAFQFSKIGAILPIDDVVEDLKSSGKISDFSDDSAELLKYDGHYVALPWNRDIRVIWYRKDLFEQAGVQPPKNWTEFREAAKKLTRGDVYGFATGGSMTSGIHFLLSMMLNNGGGLFDKDRNVAVTTDRNRETFHFISDLAKDGSINPASAGFTSDDFEKSFASGKAAMVLQNPGLDKKYPELAGKALALEPLEGPHGDKGTLNWINNIMLYKDSKHPNETKEFLKWWSENGKVLFTEGKLTALPARKSFTQDVFFTSDANNSSIITNYLPISKSTAANYTSLFPELNEIEGDTILTKAIQGLIMKKDADQILEDVQSGIESIMKKAN